MNTTFSETLLTKVPVVGILRGYSKEQIHKIVATYYQEGFTNIEITKNTANATEIIKELVEKYPTSLNVGAGTVLTEQDLDEVIEAGAQFVVTPVVNEKIITKCVALKIPVFPGAFTPTEIYNAWSLGARMVKLFPAANTEVSYLKNVLAPLNNIQIMPTGGVNIDNMEAYLNAGAKAFGMGGLLFPKKLILDGKWEELAIHLRNIKQKITTIT